MAVTLERGNERNIYIFVALLWELVYCQDCFDG